MSKRLVFIFLTLFAALFNTAEGQIITTIAGNGTTGPGGDGGFAFAAQFDSLAYVTFDTSRNIYLGDQLNNRVRIINTVGLINSIAGTGTAGYSGDSVAATLTTLNMPWGVVVDRPGNVYISDQANNRIRKVDITGLITTYAGTGAAGYSGDGLAATAAKINTPYGIAVDTFGNVYFADNGNSCIRKINTSGIISTVAGTGLPGYSGDGALAVTEKLNRPTDVDIDASGNLYICDNGNNRIRKVTSGTIRTIAGTGVAGYSGDGISATTSKINGPMGLKIDAAGNIYIADYYNNRIRKINTTGIINTIAGNGTAGYLGDGGIATATEINHPTSVAIGPRGFIYFVDRSNARLRMISQSHAPYFINGSVDSFAVCENTGSISIDTLLAIVDSDLEQTEIWHLVSAPLHSTVFANDTLPSSGGLIIASGFTYMPHTGYSGNDSFKVSINDGISSDTITIHVRINPLAVIGPITGDTTVCMSRPDTLRDIGTGGVWTTSNTKAAVSDSGIVSGLATGRDTVTYTITTVYGCIDSVKTVIHMYPVTDSITGLSALCNSYTALLTGYPAGGIWSASNASITVSSGGVITGMMDGIDTISYTYTNVCGTAFAQQIITVNPPGTPIVYITASPPVVAPGWPDTLNAIIVGSTGVYGYQWFLNNLPIPGATNSFYISSSFTNGDSVSCTISNGPCAVSTFSWIYPIISAAGVKNLSANEDALTIIPNPNNGTFTIAGTLSGSNEAALEITDIIGQVVYKAIVPVQNGLLKKEIALDNNLPDGIYLLHISSGDGNKVVRFVVGR